MDTIHKKILSTNCLATSKQQSFVGTGHCGLKGHLKKIWYSALVIVGKDDQTPNHFLQSCPFYNRERQHIWPVSTYIWSTSDNPFCDPNGTKDLTQPIERKNNKYLYNKYFLFRTSVSIREARCSSVVERLGLMGRRIDPSLWTHWAISHYIQCSTTGIKRPWYVLSCLWDGAYKRTIAANEKEGKGNVLFNDALNTFYLRLYGVG